MPKTKTDSFLRWIKETWLSRPYSDAVYSDHIGELRAWTGGEDLYDENGSISQVSFAFHPSLLRRTIGYGPKPLIKFVTIRYDSWSGDMTLTILGDGLQEMDSEVLEDLDATVSVEDGDTLVRWDNCGHTEPLAQAFRLLTATWGDWMLT